MEAPTHLQTDDGDSTIAQCTTDPSLKGPRKTRVQFQIAKLSLVK